MVRLIFFVSYTCIFCAVATRMVIEVQGQCLFMQLATNLCSPLLIKRSTGVDGGKCYVAIKVRLAGRF